MIYGNVELFNVERLENRGGIQGVMLNRFSKAAVNGLDRGEDRRGHETQSYCNDIELRFETESQAVTLKVGAWDNDGYIVVFNGEYYHSLHHLDKNVISTIELERHPRLALMPSVEEERFNRNIWRVIFLKRFQAVFTEVTALEGLINPPLYNRKTKTLLAYGSSITFGAGTGPASYLHHMRILARKLGYQLMNKSMPGSCFCEKSYGDYLSGIPAELYYYELGGNMRLRHSPEEFDKRARHIVEQTRKKNPDSPIILLTVYPLLKSIPDEDHEKAVYTIDKFNETLERLAVRDANIHLIDSSEILSETGLLSYDGLHPSGYGNIIMAERLYERIKNLI
jgi:hypothetical protein